MSLRQLLGIDIPIIQAPMAGAQGSALAIAVSKTGALGSLPCAMLSAEALRNELIAIRAQTQRPFNVNFFCHTQPAIDIEREKAWRALLSHYFIEYCIDADAVVPGPTRLPFSEEMATALAEFQPAVVSFHFGLPSDALLAKVRSWGAKIISTATNVAEAVWLEQHGVDAVIAQGWEAGGHRGNFLSNDVLSGNVWHVGAGTADCRCSKNSSDSSRWHCGRARYKRGDATRCGRRTNRHRLSAMQ
jgi:nitronate monooxygenase